MSQPESVPAVVAALIAGGLGASALLWGAILWRWNLGQTVLPPVAKPDRQRPPWAALGAIGWTAFVLLNRLVADGASERTKPEAGHVWVNLIMSAGVFVVLAMLLFAERRFTPRDAGMMPTRLTVPLGLGTFFAAGLPTFAALLALSPFRSRETQHQLLQLLGRSPDAVTLVGLAVTVVVIAPLAEEILFRVTLQGWLTERL
ncbi:MAG TPA: hypothetical protein VM165_14775, partial [Planctomycetaceae bacterium]|nr:hypothetical protein [Planctomycetaceae bacterium]